MYLTTAIIPDPGELPVAYLSGDDEPATAIPVIALAGRHASPSFNIQFQDDDTALAYCDAMIEQATLLIARIQRRQEQSARLLAAVEASPGGES